MPKEVIRPATDPFEVKVGWDPNRADVTVGVELMGERSLFWQFLGHTTDERVKLGDQIRRLALVNYEDDEQLGIAVLNLLDVCASAPGPFGYQGIHACLDRGGINRLVRVLRRARDSAFGPDE